MEWLDYYPEEYNILPCKIIFLENGDKELKIAYKWQQYQKKRYPRDKLNINNGDFFVICGNQAERDYNLVILDVDKNNGAAPGELYKKIIAKEPRLKNTLTTQTQSGGFHFHIQVDNLACYTSLTRKMNIPSIIEGIDHIDIQGTGKLAFIYPSNYYEILNAAAPKKIGDMEFLEILDNISYEPTAASDNTKQQQRKIATTTATANFSKLKKPFQDIFNGILEIESYAAKTGKLEELYWKATYLECKFKLGLSFEDTSKILENSQPAFDLKKTEQQLKYITNNKPFTNKKLQELFPDYKIAAKKTKKEEPDLYEICDLILGLHHIKSIDLGKKADYSIYDDSGYYKRNQQIKIESIISATLRELDIDFSLPKGSAILQLIRNNTLTPLNAFDKDDLKLNLENGLLDVRTLELEGHTPDYLSFRRIPVKYDSTAKCPKLSKLIAGVIGKSHITNFYQKLGLSLTPIMIFQKATFLFGSGDNGKTTLFTMIRRLLGEENCSNVDLYKFNTFSFSKIENKLINIVSDMDSSKKINVNNFKLYVGNEAVIPINKKFIPEYDVKPTAKVWYSCNETFPQVPEDIDKGFWRKIDIMECPYEYDGKEDWNLLDNIISEEELSGLLNIALVGLRFLLRRGRFNKKYYHWEQVKDFWLMKLNEFQQFIEQTAEKQGLQYHTEKSHTLKQFNKWLNDKGKKGISATRLTKIINATPKFHYEPNTKKIISGIKKRVYFGFQLPQPTLVNHQKAINEE